MGQDEGLLSLAGPGRGPAPRGETARHQEGKKPYTAGSCGSYRTGTYWYLIILLLYGTGILDSGLIFILTNFA